MSRSTVVLFNGSRGVYVILSTSLPCTSTNTKLEDMPAAYIGKALLYTLHHRVPSSRIHSTMNAQVSNALCLLRAICTT